MAGGKGSCSIATPNGTGGAFWLGEVRLPGGDTPASPGEAGDIIGSEKLLYENTVYAVAPNVQCPDARS